MPRRAGVLTTFDYVIVGGGTAGCLLANRLSADPRTSVLLVEAGGKGWQPWLHVPIGYLHAVDHPSTDWRYRTTPQPGLHGRSLAYPRGRCLGGCSSVNGMIYMRGQSRDYDHWAALTGEPEWAWQHALPDFLAHEDHHGGDAPLHRRGGEWPVARQRLRWDLLDAVALAAQQAGIPPTMDFNGGSNEGVGYFEVNQRRGWRRSARQAFLDPVRGRPNLTVWTHSAALGLELAPHPSQPWRCAGLRIARDVDARIGDDRRLAATGGTVVTVQARREVILAAGAIGTPVLLQAAGIGPADWLAAAGVPLRHELRGVGANLQDHLQLRSVWAVQNATTLNTLARSPWRRAAMLLDFLLRARGPLSMAPSQLGAFARSRPGLDWPDLEFHVQPLSLPAFGEPLDPFPAFTASVCHLNPESRGSVRIVSPSPLDPPRISPEYLATDGDRRVAADALRLVRRVVAQPALARHAPRELTPGPALTRDDELARAAGEIGTTIFHPVGTTRMGRADDADAVVDPRLRVRGIAGLRVVDAGVMPVITSGNTASPVLMIAEKAARWIGADAARAG